MTLDRLCLESIRPTTYITSVFYRAMHYSAKRGIAIACCLSVCLSVTLVDCDHISWKLHGQVAQHVRSCSQRAIHLIPGEHGEIWGRLYRWVGKRACCSTKEAIFRKRVTIKEKLLWRVYRNSPTLFRTVGLGYHFRPPTASCFPRLGVRIPTQNFNHDYPRNG